MTAPAPGVLRWLATQQPPGGSGEGAAPRSALTQQIIERFPEFATILGIPDVANLIETLPPGASSAYFQEQLWHTKWWKDTPESSRTWQARKLVDPATAGQQSKLMAANVIAAASSLGLNLTPNEVAWYTEFANSEGWDETALTRAIVDTHARQKFHAGTINATQDSLRGIAADYGVRVGDETAFKWASQIATGRQTNEGFEDWARNQAKANFPQLEKEIDSGLTVRQVADPYMQIAADTLGLNPSTMLLTDPKWQRALQHRDAKGNLAGPMSTQDWQRHIMTDAAYDYGSSANGQLAALQLRDSLSQTFGIEGT